VSSGQVSHNPLIIFEIEIIKATAQTGNLHKIFTSFSQVFHVWAVRSYQLVKNIQDEQEKIT